MAHGPRVGRRQILDRRNARFAKSLTRRPYRRILAGMWDRLADVVYLAALLGGLVSLGLVLQAAQ